MDDEPFNELRDYNKEANDFFSEFGKSSKDPGYSPSARDSFLNVIYSNIYNFARSGGNGGGLVWKIMAEGMQSYDDRYVVQTHQIMQQVK